MANESETKSPFQRTADALEKRKTADQLRPGDRPKTRVERASSHLSQSKKYPCQYGHAMDGEILFREFLQVLVINRADYDEFLRLSETWEELNKQAEDSSYDATRMRFKELRHKYLADPTQPGAIEFIRDQADLREEMQAKAKEARRLAKQARRNLAENHLAPVIVRILTPIRDFVAAEAKEATEGRRETLEEMKIPYRAAPVEDALYGLANRIQDQIENCESGVIGDLAPRNVFKGIFSVDDAEFVDGTAVMNQG